MYISILFGAAYGVLIGAVLSCIVSTDNSNSLPSLTSATTVRSNGRPAQLYALGRCWSSLAHDRVIQESARAVAGENYG